MMPSKLVKTDLKSKPEKPVLTLETPLTAHAKTTRHAHSKTEVKDLKGLIGRQSPQSPKSPTLLSFCTSQKQSLRRKNTNKSSEPKRTSEMSTKEMMSISERLLAQLRETMETIARRKQTDHRNVGMKSSRKLTQQVSEMALRYHSHKHLSPYVKKSSVISLNSNKSDPSLTQNPKPTKAPVPASNMSQKQLFLKTHGPLTTDTALNKTSK